jgi:hypothetical protein
LLGEVLCCLATFRADELHETSHIVQRSRRSKPWHLRKHEPTDRTCALKVALLGVGAGKYGVALHASPQVGRAAKLDALLTRLVARASVGPTRPPLLGLLLTVCSQTVRILLDVAAHVRGNPPGQTHSGGRVCTSWDGLVGFKSRPLPLLALSANTEQVHPVAHVIARPGCRMPPSLPRRFLQAPRAA